MRLPRSVVAGCSKPWRANPCDRHGTAYHNPCRVVYNMRPEHETVEVRLPPGNAQHWPGHSVAAHDNATVREEITKMFSGPRGGELGAYGIQLVASCTSWST